MKLLRPIAVVVAGIVVIYTARFTSNILTLYDIHGKFSPKLITQALAGSEDLAEKPNYMPTTSFVLDSNKEKSIKLSNNTDEKQFIERYVQIEVPLKGGDYYAGKYENARAGVKEMNTLPLLKPGDRIRLIGDGYVTIGRGEEYVGSAYRFGSGVCWSVSAIGKLMDEANYKFKKEYGMPLFVFRPGDRAPHSHYYVSYANINRGYGYTVLKGYQDYSFTVNPEIKNNEKLKNLKVDINMTYTNKHPNAVRGYSIGGYVILQF